MRAIAAKTSLVGTEKNQLKEKETKNKNVSLRSNGTD